MAVPGERKSMLTEKNRKKARKTMRKLNSYIKIQAEKSVLQTGSWCQFAEAGVLVRIKILF